jgi:cytochrome c biogenesis protein CcmG, thiol:disulfide interchange protein DsbE
MARLTDTPSDDVDVAGPDDPATGSGDDVAGVDEDQVGVAVVSSDDVTDADPDGPDDDVPVDDGGDEVELDSADAPRRVRTALVVSAVLAVLAVGFVAVLATREPATDRESDSPLLGQDAPALAGETLDGGSFDVADNQGRWVVVNFFATWCVPCRQEHPELVGFDRSNGGEEDPVLVSVVYDDDPGTARDYFEENGGDWPVVLDPDGRVALDYAVAGVPETYLIAPSGQVVAKLTGGVTQGGLEGVIADWEEQVGG